VNEGVVGAASYRPLWRGRIIVGTKLTRRLERANCVTKRAGATQAQVRRMIQAARREGLRIAGIRPDGTVVVYEEKNPLVPIDQPVAATEDADALCRWGDGDG
jgi:hypothetical protein